MPNLNEKIIALCLTHGCQAFLNDFGSVTMEIRLTHPNWQHVGIERVPVKSLKETLIQLGY